MAKSKKTKVSTKTNNKWNLTAKSKYRRKVIYLVGNTCLDTKASKNKKPNGTKWAVLIRIDQKVPVVTGVPILLDPNWEIKKEKVRASREWLDTMNATEYYKAGR